jgi:alpha-ribazole phosphatase
VSGSSTRWWWVRHGPVAGAPARIFGQLDLSCDTSDAETIARLGRLLPRNAVRIVSSLKRTRETLAAIDRVGADDPADPLIEPAFAEQHFGRWQGLSWAEMAAADPQAYRGFWQDPTGSAPPEGESFAALMVRVHAAIQELTTRFAGRDIVAIAHGGTIRAAVALALGLEATAAMAIVVDNLCVTRLSHIRGDGLKPGGGEWRVECVNGPAVWISPSESC